MAMMKDIFTWFAEKYDRNDDYTNMLFLCDPPPQNGKGIRIVIKHGWDVERMSYIQDLFEGKDYSPYAAPHDIYKVLTKTIDEIMKGIPK